MKLFTAVILSTFWFFAFTAAQNEGAHAQGTGQTVGREAVWKPGPGIMDGIREKCGSLTGAQFSECFISSMESSGASPQALDFTRSSGNTAYLRDFRETGKIDVAFVYYPFKANENYGCFFVNGDPPFVDVDDPKYQPKDAFQKDRQYNSLVKEFPQLSRWPGQRSGAGYPLLKKLPGHGQRFVVGYRLLNGCHSCERLGNAWFAFDFDKNGKFMGTRLMGIDRNTALDKATVEDGRVRDENTDPKMPIEVAVGREFTIVLGANQTTGYRWELAKPLDGGLVERIRNEYKIQNGGKRGAGGKEIWTFKAIGEGKTKITMKYIRSLEKNTGGVKTVTFDVVVKR
jgi:predicted secreted protein